MCKKVLNFHDFQNEKAHKTDGTAFKQLTRLLCVPSFKKSAYYHFLVEILTAIDIVIIRKMCYVITK